MTLSDILAFVGPSGGPVVIAGATYAFCAWFEDGMSPAAKMRLSEYLLGIRPPELSKLAIDAVNKIFGPRHWSLRCFAASVIVSLLVVGVLVTAHLLRQWQLDNELNLDGFVLQLASVYVALAILVDYLSLYKTRFLLFILRAQERRQSIKIILYIIPLLIADFALGYLIFIAIFLIGFGLTASEFRIWDVGHWYSLWAEYFSSFSLMGAITDDLPAFLSFQELPSAFFWASMAPSLWLWLYAIALEVTPFVVGIVGLKNVLAVETRPLRSVGMVAAVLVFLIALIAHLLLSR